MTRDQMGKLLVQNWELINRYSLRITKWRRADADDIAQSACLRLLEASTRVQWRQGSKPFLTSVVWVVAREMRTNRRRYERRLCRYGFSLDTELNRHNLDPHATLWRRSIVRAVRDAVHDLPERWRRIISRKHLDGLQIRDVATELIGNACAIGVAARRAENVLRVTLAEVARDERLKTNVPKFRKYAHGRPSRARIPGVDLL